MEPVETFIQFCHKLCEQYKGRDPDYQQVGRQIEEAAKSLPEHVHPMITSVCNSAFDLAYDLPLDSNATKQVWEDICDAVQRYIAGQWEPTAWSLVATYLIGRDQGLSVSVTRKHGHVKVETASPELSSIVTPLLKQINDRQTDEWYLHNLARLLPEQAGNLTKMNAEVHEYII